MKVSQIHLFVFLYLQDYERLLSICFFFQTFGSMSLAVR